jgi:hypothetical protein
LLLEYRRDTCHFPFEMCTSALGYILTNTITWLSCAVLYLDMSFSGSLGDPCRFQEGKGEGDVQEGRSP